MISMETIFFLFLIMHTETKHSELCIILIMYYINIMLLLLFHLQYTELCIERKNRESWLIFSRRRKFTSEMNE